MNFIDNKNPGSNDGRRPLDAAAEGGHLNICKYIMEKIKNKNPGSNNGWTPLHSSAKQGMDHWLWIPHSFEKFQNAIFFKTLKFPFMG